MAGRQASDHDVAAESGDAPACGCCERALHREELGAGRSVCLVCEREVAHRLTDVEQLWKLLPACTAKGSPLSDTGAGSASTGSQAPGNLAVFSLLAGDVPRRLQVHERAWRLIRGTPAPADQPAGQDRQLRDVLGYLRINLDWACRTPAADVKTLRGDVRHLAAEMMSAITGERDRRVTVPYPCPLPALGFADDDERAPACGALLRMYPAEREIRCTGCKRRVPRHHWHRIGLLVGSITLEGQAAA
jgi:hypothetical protein